MEDYTVLIQVAGHLDSIKTALAEKHVLATILPARKKEKDPP